MADRRLFKNLVPVPRNRILAYMDSPSFDGWVAIRETPVVAGMTLWDVMDTIDRCWPGTYPPALLVARASYEVDRRQADLDLFDVLPPLPPIAPVA